MDRIIMMCSELSHLRVQHSQFEFSHRNTHRAGILTLRIDFWWIVGSAFDPYGNKKALRANKKTRYVPFENKPQVLRVARCVNMATGERVIKLTQQSLAIWRITWKKRWRGPKLGRGARQRLRLTSQYYVTILPCLEETANVSQVARKYREGLDLWD
jgi:hypothetical protein